jgi:3-oxoacyl-[acyl-carrier-protein] synthase II
MGVVVTGMAICSPYGNGTETFWQGLTGGHSGQKPITRFSVDNWVYRTKAAATIETIGLEENGDAERSAMEILSAVTDDVIIDSGIEPKDVSPYEVAVCLGSSQTLTNVFLNYLHRERGAGSSPESFADYSWISAGSVLFNVTRKVKAQGPALVVSTACASGTSSIGVAYDLIRQGRAKRAFAGGVGFFSALSFSGFNILRLTGRDGCRPFDTSRDGMMFGDGFALVVLEDEDFAKQRGAKIKAKILGYATANEAYHPTSPAPDGETGFRVMWQALNRSQENLARLDYINAHGTGTLVNDTSELNAITRLVSLRDNAEKPAVSSTKGHHGHSLGATGSVEFIATVLALNHQTAPPNLGLETPEPGFEKLDLVSGKAHPRRIRVALSNSFAFGGNVASIAIENISGDHE